MPNVQEIKIEIEKEWAVNKLQSTLVKLFTMYPEYIEERINSTVF